MEAPCARLAGRAEHSGGGTASPILSAHKDLDGGVRHRDHSVAEPPSPEPRHPARAAERPALPRRVETPPARCWLSTSRASPQRSATRHDRGLQGPHVTPQPNRPTLRTHRHPAKQFTYCMRDGSVPTSSNGRTEASGGTVVGAGTGESRPRMQSAATVCASMERMLHQRRV